MNIFCSVWISVFGKERPILCRTVAPYSDTGGGPKAALLADTDELLCNLRYEIGLTDPMDAPDDKR
jgi:hypothetical protein